jgi:hypothetical protein
MLPLSIEAEFQRIITVNYQRERFIENNTNPMPEYEADGTPVFRIRYYGMANRPVNQFGLR